MLQEPWTSHTNTLAPRKYTVLPNKQRPNPKTHKARSNISITQTLDRPARADKEQHPWLSRYSVTMATGRCQHPAPVKLADQCSTHSSFFNSFIWTLLSSFLFLQQQQLKVCCLAVAQRKVFFVQQPTGRQSVSKAPSLLTTVATAR